MRSAPALLILMLAGCGEPGALRDRSLMARADDGMMAGAATPTRRPTQKSTTSVIGLVADPLAPLYAENADLVVRFDHLNALRTDVLPQIAAVRKALPGLHLPAGPPSSLLHTYLGLPEALLVDPLRPFALVRTEAGWTAVLPVRLHESMGKRMRALDGIYSVVGTPKQVEAYRASFRKGFYLPGSISVVARPEAVPELAPCIAGVCDWLGLPAPDLVLPADFERLDGSIRFGADSVRIDVRAVPTRESATGTWLERLRPRPAETIRALPGGGTVYLESGASQATWESLLLGWRGHVAPLTPLRAAFDLLGEDSAAMLDLEPDGTGTLLLLSKLDRPEKVPAFLASPLFKLLLEELAGPGGHLEYAPHSFSRGDVHVDAISGHLSSEWVREMRRGGLVPATLSVKMRGPVICYVATVRDHLCLAFGTRARAEMEALIDRVAAGKSRENEHRLEATALFPLRVAAATIDLGALYDGIREAAPLWHADGRKLRRLSMRERVPVSGALTVVGGAFRFALRTSPRELAEAAARIRDKLAAR